MGTSNHWIAKVVVLGCSAMLVSAHPVIANPNVSASKIQIADGLSKEAIKKVRKDFDIVLVELDERDFPEAFDFITQAASSVETNRQYLGNDADYAKISVLVDQARTAIKNKQFLPARRTINQIMEMLGRLQASVPAGVA